MITWTSDRSGMASTGVFHTAYAPQIMIATVASNTRKTCRIDHSMTLPTISVSSVAAEGRIVIDWPDGNDDILASGLLDKIEYHLLPGLQRTQPVRIG